MTCDLRAVGALLVSLGTDSMKVLRKGVVVPSLALRVMAT